MKAVVDLTNDEYTRLKEKENNLNNKLQGHDRSNLFNFDKKFGYASYDFKGYFTDELIEVLGHKPDEEEIIMIVDGGFSHYGASCTITGHNFSGRVFID